MKTKPILLFLLLPLLAITACQKEVNFPDGQQNGNNPPGTNPPAGNTSVKGVYDFLGMSANVSSTISVTQAGQELKAVTSGYYISRNNTGTMEFTDAALVAKGVGYTIDTTVQVKTYLSGLLIDTQNTDFQVTNPPMDDSTPYTQNSADSLTFQNPPGGFLDPTGTSVPSGPAGAKLSWSGDTLSMHFKLNYSASISQGGVPATLQALANAVVQLKKHK